MYCNKCNYHNTPGSNYCSSCGAQLLYDKAELLQKLSTHLENQFSCLQYSLTDNTDIALYALLTDYRWLLGWRKVEYKAKLLIDTDTKIAYFWETIKESGQGMEPPFFFRKYVSHTNSDSISGQITESAGSTQNNKYSYSWDYAQIRTNITDFMTLHGFSLKIVLLPSKAERKP